MTILNIISALILIISIVLFNSKLFFIILTLSAFLAISSIYFLLEEFGAFDDSKK
jgi:hypothetical protein